MSDDADYSLVMPFVVCRSQGGPYDDQSFVAGWEMGALDALLANFPTRRFGRTVRTASMPQVELIAMRYGYTVEAETTDEWTTATFTRSPPTLDPGKIYD